MEFPNGLSTDAFRARIAMDAPTAIVVVAAASRTVVAVNDAATELFGRGRSSLVGMDQTELHPPAESDRYRAEFDAMCDDGRSAFTDDGESVRIQRRDGTAIPVDTDSTVAEYEGTDYAVVSFRDAGKRAARAERLERQATAIDISPAGVALLDADGVYTYLNGAHVSMFGYDSADEICGGTWRQLYDDEVASRIEAEVLPALRMRVREVLDDG